MSDERRERLRNWVRLGGPRSTLTTVYADDLQAELEDGARARALLQSLHMLLVGASGTLGRAVDMGLPQAADMQALTREGAMAIADHLEGTK